ncbi:MAG TPA: hypothetical protein PLE30_11435, partial [Candidatus Kapabacteria bacterium]|nr:hypothetical protein [Candidatus Kapabacteria bacterium]
LWEKYTGWTGYQYSGNNPVNLVDRDGRVVIATDKASKDNIINSVEKPYRNLVAFNDNGVAYLKENPKLNPLMKDVQNLSNIGNFTNIGALQYLVNHKDVIEVSQNKYINFEQTEGENSGIYNSYNLDGDRANGATLLKSSTNESVVSLKNVHQVIVSPNQFTGLSGPATKGSTTAHELYGHLFLYLWGQNGWGTPYYRGHEGETRKHIIKAEQNSK